MVSRLKAITICQPYASLIVGWDGMPPGIQKRIENRTWFTDYRGSLLIHAGKSRKWLDSWDGPVPSVMPFGCIVGAAKLVTCLRKRDTPTDRENVLSWVHSHIHAEGPWMWVLDRIERFAEPIPYRGKQGLYDVPFGIIAGSELP